MRVIPVILCGGEGTRLWPLSRGFSPKQLLALVDDYSLLQNTAKRFSDDPKITSPIIVCNEEHRFLVAEQLRKIEIEALSIILEPEGRNTAPATALAAHNALKLEDDAILIVLPSDHVVKRGPEFHDAVSKALDLAREGALVTFGVVPSKPETGYGYIKRGKTKRGAYEVDEFIEKPGIIDAIKFLDSGMYYWNSGMFVFKARAYLDELEAYSPEIDERMKQASASAIIDLDFTRVNSDVFISSPSDSIDCAVMEHTANAVVVPLDAGWNDIGSWDALWEISEKDADYNTLIGDVVAKDVENSYVWSEGRLVVAAGLKNVVIVETADAVMVVSKGRSQQVKSIVAELKEEGRVEGILHQKVFRPWGCYEVLDADKGFLLKRITVNPHASLSLQLHEHRAEHWVVVSGTATVTIEDEITNLKPGKSCYIPLQTRHRLQNLTNEQLVVVEVQSGVYLSEDDIIRIEDKYGR